MIMFNMSTCLTCSIDKEKDKLLDDHLSPRGMRTDDKWETKRHPQARTREQLAPLVA